MPGYLTKQECIAVAGVADLNIRSLLDNQQFADPDGLAAQRGISSAAWPLFGLLWPSGAELAARMALRRVLPGERILEIGCGLGLASLVGHRRGADVTASDCHPLAAAFMAENLKLNHLTPLKYRHGLWGARAAQPRGDAAPASRPTPQPAPQPALGPGQGLSPARNDGSEPVSGQFELIMGSDVLYERDEAGSLAAFINNHATPAAEVWIVDPHRGNRPTFNRRMAEHGFVVTEQRLDRLATPLRAAYRGRMLTYVRASPPLSA
jgi:predicted nicotinamide N-methyase